MAMDQHGTPYDFRIATLCESGHPTALHLPRDNAAATSHRYANGVV